LVDATAELNVYALRKWTAPGLVKTLQAKERPQLADILGDREVMIDLLIGVDDEGTGDTILIHSSTTWPGRYSHLFGSTRPRFRAYEADVDGISDVPGFLERIGLLLNLGEEGDLSRGGGLDSEFGNEQPGLGERP
jgi:hypothetical protein